MSLYTTGKHAVDLPEGEPSCGHAKSCSPHRCNACDQIKPARAFYDSCQYMCMECKRAKVSDYKRRTGYNVAYRQRRKEGQ